MKTSTVAALAISLFLCACSTKSHTEIAPQDPVVQIVQAPGVVTSIWEPPLVDVIDVPPGLDPEGHYYRPAHEEVVEIRQGRWRYVKKPEDKIE